MSFEAEMEATPLTNEQAARLLALAVDRAPEELAKLDSAVDQSSVFYALPRATMAAFRLNDFARSESLALQLLSLAVRYRTDWNYGNAIHFAHTALGLLALRDGDVVLAGEELAASGATPGSPQLDSFGPSMQLAKALLRADQFEPVIAYFAQCRVFWKLGAIWLDVWEEKVRRHQMPNFHMNWYR